MTFGEWWDEWKETILEKTYRTLTTDHQRMLLFKDAYLEGYEEGHEAHKREKRCQQEKKF